MASASQGIKIVTASNPNAKYKLVRTKTVVKTETLDMILAKYSYRKYIMQLNLNKYCYN